MRSCIKFYYKELRHNLCFVVNVMGHPADLRAVAILFHFIRRTNEIMRGTHEFIRGTHEIIRGTNEFMRGTNEIIRETHEYTRKRNEIMCRDTLIYMSEAYIYVRKVQKLFPGVIPIHQPI